MKRIVSAVVGFYLLAIGMGGMELPGFNMKLSAGLQALALLAGFALLGFTLWSIAREYDPAQDDGQTLQDPPFVRFLFSSRRSAPIWLGVRIFVGLDWFLAGFHKLINPAWMSGKSLEGFWQNAVSVSSTGKSPVTYDWYRAFLSGLLSGGHQVWFAPFVAVGETLVGIALILGMFVGIAAFFGALMNMNFMLAGSASSNPVLFALALLLILAWKVAGYYGLDHYLLAMFGAPWAPGTFFNKAPSAA